MVDLGFVQIGFVTGLEDKKTGIIVLWGDPIGATEEVTDG